MEFALDPLKQFRLMTVKLSLILIVLAAGSALVFDWIVAQGFLLGGLAGVIAFWILARTVEKFASIPKEKLQSYSFRLTLVRLVIYALVLYRAYTLDEETWHGLLAAVAGLLITRVVIIFLAITGHDLKQGKE